MLTFAAFYVTRNRTADESMRSALAATLVVFYVVVVIYVLLVPGLVESLGTGTPAQGDQAATESFKQGIVTSLTGFVGVVLAFYFGASAVTDRRRPTQRRRRTPRRSTRMRRRRLRRQLPEPVRWPEIPHGHRHRPDPDRSDRGGDRDRHLSGAAPKPAALTPAGTMSERTNPWSHSNGSRQPRRCA